MQRFAVRWFATCVALMCGLAAGGTVAQTYNYVTATELKRQMDAGDAPMIVDVQSEREFARGHLPNAIATNAFPVDTSAQRDRLKPIVSRILSSKKDVVIVCPSGADAAENAYKFLQDQGVPTQRLAILKGGQRKYPYFDVIREKP